MADDPEKAIARVKHLVVLRQTLEREWREAEPALAALAAHDPHDPLFREWQHWRKLFEAEHQRREAHKRIESAYRHGELQSRDVNEYAKKIFFPVAMEWLDGTRPPHRTGIHTMDSELALYVYTLVISSERHPEEGTRACIAEAVRARLASFRKKHRAWSNEEKAKSLVRAALAALGWTRDPFVADRVERHRKGSST